VARIESSGTGRAVRQPVEKGGQVVGGPKIRIRPLAGAPGITGSRNLRGAGGSVAGSNVVNRFQGGTAKLTGVAKARSVGGNAYAYGSSRAKSKALGGATPQTRRPLTPKGRGAPGGNPGSVRRSGASAGIQFRFTPPDLSGLGDSIRNAIGELNPVDKLYKGIGNRIKDVTSR
jgi:hypothetical protein